MAAENTGLNVADLSVVLCTLYDAVQVASGHTLHFTYNAETIQATGRKVCLLMNSLPVKLGIPIADSEQDATEKRFSNIL